MPKARPHAGRGWKSRSQSAAQPKREHWRAKARRHARHDAMTPEREHEGQPIRLAAAHPRCPKRRIRSEKSDARVTDQSRPSKNARTQSAMQLPKPTTLESFSPGLTPELSRAAKRRRLGRIVRADVTAEAREPQAATPRMTREPLTGIQVTRRPRLEKPKPERRPAEARTLASEGAMASTARRDDTRAPTRRSTHALGGGAPALPEAMRPKREAQRASHRPTPTQQKCENAERDAVAEADNTGKLFPRPNT